MVHEEAGVTRDRKELPCEWNGREFILIDTGGLDFEAGDQISRAIQEQARAAIADADVVALVLDAKAGLAPGRRGGRRDPAPLRHPGGRRREQGRRARRTSRRWQTSSALALGEPMGVSAAQGRSTGDLLDRLVEALPAPDPDAEDEPDRPRLALIGRPNVGKSSLVNRFLGSNRVIVSEIAGTTRDAIDTELQVGDRSVLLVDTAGLRKRSRVSGSVEFYAQIRSERAAQRADVAIVVVDASEGLTSEDLRVADLAMKSGCATIFALNKWDEVAMDLEDVKARIAQRVRQRPPVITTSALNGRNVDKLLAAAIELADRRAQRIPTPKLNRFVAEVVDPPPASVQAGQAPAPLLLGAGGRLAAANSDPGERPPPHHPGLGLPPREPDARALRARGSSPDNRFRAQGIGRQVPFVTAPARARSRGRRVIGRMFSSVAAARRRRSAISWAICSISSAGPSAASAIASLRLGIDLAAVATPRCGCGGGRRADRAGRLCRGAEPAVRRAGRGRVCA